MLSQHLPNQLKFPTHCAKPRGVPPKLNCGLFHTFGCDIELSLRTMLLVQYLRAVIYILNICSVLLCWCWCTIIFCVVLNCVWTGVNIVRIFARYEWWHGKDWYVIRLYHYIFHCCVCMILSHGVWYYPMCVILPNMCVILFQCVWYYPMVWYSPAVLGPAPRSTLSAIVSDFQRSQSSHHSQSLSIRRVKWCHLRFAFCPPFSESGLVSCGSPKCSKIQAMSICNVCI